MQARCKRIACRLATEKLSPRVGCDAKCRWTCRSCATHSRSNQSVETRKTGCDAVRRASIRCWTKRAFGAVPKENKPSHLLVWTCKRACVTWLNTFFNSFSLHGWLRNCEGIVVVDSYNTPLTRLSYVTLSIREIHGAIGVTDGVRGLPTALLTNLM